MLQFIIRNSLVAIQLPLLKGAKCDGNFGRVGARRGAVKDNNIKAVTACHRDRFY